MKNSNSKLIAIFLFCVVQLTYGENKPGFADKLKTTATTTASSAGKKINSSSSTNGAALSSDEITIDTKNNSIKSKDGIKLQSNELKLQAQGFERDTESDLITTNGDVQVSMNEGPNEVRIDSKKMLLSPNNNSLKYYDSVSYMEVGNITGAEAPNTRIYFGGAVGESNDDAFSLKNAWFTTDFQIVDTKDYKKGGYYLLSNKLNIIPDNKAEFQNVELYIQDKRVGWFPWYAVNIRQGSEVPLFPEWGDDSDYGFHIESGINYGSGKFKGGISPMYSDRQGLLIGRFEQWYDFDSVGKGLVTVDNLLVSKKESSLDDRWDINANHEYKNDKGFLKLGFKSTTVNEISALEDHRDDLERSGFYDPTNKNYGGKERNDGEAINFLTMDSKFKGLGDRGDLEVYSKVKLLAGGEDAYRQLVDDQMDDASFGSQLDNKLFADFGFKKDNSDYMISAYYDYMNDLDPGSTNADDDDQSRRENFGAAINLKEPKVYFSYDHEKGDKLRKLRSWERTPDYEDLVNLQGGHIEYTPWSVLKYDIDNSDKFKLELGEYSFFNTNINYKLKYNGIRKEEKLNLDDDPFRWASGSQNTSNPSANTKFNLRDQQYNKEENIIYENTTEDQFATEFLYNQYRLEFTFGRSKEEVWDREGIYNYANDIEGDSYNRYENESNFTQLELENKMLSLGILGDLGLRYNIRYDDYTKGYDTYSKDNTGGDSSLRHQVNFNHKLDLFDNTKDHFRDIDLKLKNEFNYFGQLYTYNNGDRTGNSEYNGQVRLKNKDNVNELKDKVTFDLGNTTTIFSTGYKQTNDAYDKTSKKGDLFTNNIDFLVDDEKKLNLYFDLDKRYTRGELTPTGYTYKDEHNDLTNEKFGGSFYFNDAIRFYYGQENNDYSLLESSHLVVTDPNYNYGAIEEVKESTYGLELKNDLDVYNFTYTHGVDTRFDDETNTFNINSDVLGASYLNGGDIEHYFKVTYGVYKYGPTQSLKDFSVDQVSFRYEYRDKRFTDQELRSYAAAEYNKNSLDITGEEISRVRSILNERNDNQLDFHLNSMMLQEMERPEYKKFFKLSLMAKVNREAYSQNKNFYESSKELEGDLYTSYKRYGLGYKYREEASFDNNYLRKVTKQEHEFRGIAGIGKPSQGWNVKVTYKTEVDEDDEWGAYIGKEMGYYEWGVGFTREYNRHNRKYEDRLAVQFTLLTFPDNPIFGIGYKEKNHSMSPKVWVGSGIEVEEPNK